MEGFQIKGFFYSLENKELFGKEFNCLLKIDYLLLKKSSLTLSKQECGSYINAFVQNSELIFKNDKFYIKLRRESLEIKDIFNASFKVIEFRLLKSKAKEIIYESSLIDSLNMRLPQNFELSTKYFKIIPVYYTKYYYFKIVSSIHIPTEEVDFIFRIISSMTSSFFGCRKFTNTNMQLVYFNKISKSCRFFEIGSFEKTFPISFYRLYKLKENIHIFSSILAEYTFSITREDIEYRFFKCMNLLDFIIEKTSKIRKRQSYRLKNIFDSILSKPELEHLRKITPYYDKIIEKQNNIKPVNFEFYNYRNGVYHRGFQLIDDEDIEKLLYCIHTVNEIIRILISNFDKMSFSSKKSKLSINSNPSIEEIVSLTKAYYETEKDNAKLI
ncbi:MAG: hypothetical protein P9M11_06730 [Candidatus Tenebribacter burtonii]|nr:hypothetical protein [Candidatus Tenebribacter burtonii]